MIALQIAYMWIAHAASAATYTARGNTHYMPSVVLVMQQRTSTVPLQFFFLERKYYCYDHTLHIADILLQSLAQITASELRVIVDMRRSS